MLILGNHQILLSKYASGIKIKLVDHHDLLVGSLSTSILVSSETTSTSFFNHTWQTGQFQVNDSLTFLSALRNLFYRKYQSQLSPKPTALRRATLAYTQKLQASQRNVTQRRCRRSQLFSNINRRKQPNNRLILLKMEWVPRGIEQYLPVIACGGTKGCIYALPGMLITTAIIVFFGSVGFLSCPFPCLSVPFPKLY